MAKIFQKYPPGQGGHYGFHLYLASSHPGFPGSACNRHRNRKPSPGQGGRTKRKYQRFCRPDRRQPWQPPGKLHNLLFHNFEGFRGQAGPFPAGSGQRPPLVHFHHHGAAENHHEAPSHPDGRRLFQ